MTTKIYKISLKSIFSPDSNLKKKLMTQNISQQWIFIIMFFRQVLYISTSAWVVRVCFFKSKAPLPFPYCFFEIAPEYRSKVIKPSTSVWVQISLLLNVASIFSFFNFLAWKMLNSIFWPAFGVRSSQMLVKIYNKQVKQINNRTLIEIWYSYDNDYLLIPNA